MGVHSQASSGKPELVASWALGLLIVGCATVTPRFAPFVGPKVPNSSTFVKVHWVFLDPGFIANVRIDLGTKGTLYAGENGRRALVAADGKVLHSTIPLPAPIIAARANADGSLTYLTPPLGVYLSKDPLGAYKSVHAPEDPISYDTRLAVAGRRAWVVIKGNDIKRSVDGGATWSNLNLPKAPFTADNLRMDENGHGAVLFLPRWQLETEDDGATWHDSAGSSTWPAAEPRYEVLEASIRTLEHNPGPLVSAPSSRDYSGAQTFTRDPPLYSLVTEQRRISAWRGPPACQPQCRWRPHLVAGDGAKHKCETMFASRL